jgi:hypothetical protein
MEPNRVDLNAHVHGLNMPRVEINENLTIGDLIKYS